MPLFDEGIRIPPLAHRKREGTERPGFAARPVDEERRAKALGGIVGLALAQDQITLLGRKHKREFQDSIPEGKSQYEFLRPLPVPQPLIFCTEENPAADFGTTPI